MNEQSIISSAEIERAIMQRFSPFPELSMDLLTRNLNSFRVGELRPAGRMWEVMMERDGKLSGPASKRYMDVSKLGWDIMKMATAEESKEVERQKEAFTYFFNHLRVTSALEQDEIGGISLLVRQMMTAKAYKYSIHETLLRVDSASRREVTAEFRHCPIWMFESRRGYLGYLTETLPYHGIKLQPGEWFAAVDSGITGGLMRQCSIAYAIKHFPLADMLLFCHRFGIPGVHGKTDATKDSPEWNAFVEALQAFMNDWITVTNKGADITLIEAAKGGSGTLPFPELINASNQLYSELFRGGNLATTSAPDSIGAEMQKGEKNIFLEDDAGWAEENIFEKIIRPFSHYIFNAEPLVYLKFRTPKPDTSTRDIASATFLRDSKVPLDQDDVRERLGWKAPEKDSILLQSPDPAPAPSPFGKRPLSDPALANSEDPQNFAAALAEDLQPYLQAFDERLQRILEISDAELRVQKFQALWAEFEPMRKDILADPSSARALESIMARGFVSGIAAKAPQS